MVPNNKGETIEFVNEVPEHIRYVHRLDLLGISTAHKENDVEWGEYTLAILTPDINTHQILVTVRSITTFYMKETVR